MFLVFFLKNGSLEKQKRDEEKVKKEKIAKDWTTDTATEQSGLELSSDDTDKARADNFQNSNPLVRFCQII